MAIFGSPYSSGFGNPDNHIGFIKAVPSQGGISISVQFAPATGWGNADFGIYLNSQLSQTVYAAEGQTTDPVDIRTAIGTQEQSITVLRHGGIGAYNMKNQARQYEDTSKLVTVEWSWAYEPIGTFDSGGDTWTDLTNWTITGLSYAQGINEDLPTRRSLEISSVVSGGNVTITLSGGGGEVASGTAAVGATVTLAALNDSGITGSVDAGAGVASDTGELLIRFPESINIYRNTANPPTTIVAVVGFNDGDAGIWTEPTDLTPDTYYYATQFISDTGDDGDKSIAEAVLVPTPPEAPTNIDYLSGAAATTIIDWTASATVGATYNLYFQNIGDPFMDMTTPQQTLIAGSVSATLPAITGYAGIAHVVIRAVDGGLEERNGVMLELEYDSTGVYVPPRPDAPGIFDTSVDAGTTLSVQATYSTVGVLTEADTVELFTRTPSGSYDFTTPDDTASIASGSGSAAYALTTTLSNGWYYVTAKTSTSGTQSTLAATEVQVYVSDVNATAPNDDAIISRG